MKLFEQPAHVLHDMLVNKEITSLELTQAVLVRIDEVEGDVQAYLTITREEALAQAKAVDEKIAKGEEIAFLGVFQGLSRIISAPRVLRLPVHLRSSRNSFHHMMLLLCRSWRLRIL